MDPRLRSQIEIETLYELLPELDPYKLLGLSPDCAQSDVDAAFRGESRRLHPDRHTAGSTPEFRAKVNETFKAVNDAYRTLRDPDARARHDSERRATEQKLSDEARRAAEAEVAAKTDPARAARTDRGGRYWKMALQNWNDGDFNGCVMNINFALSFEPDNAVFKEWQAKARLANDEKKRDKNTANAYKIRL